MVVCWYCGTDDVELAGYWPLSDHERQSREMGGFVPIEEPIQLCAFCDAAAVGVGGQIHGNRSGSENRETEKRLSRYFNELLRQILKADSREEG